MLFGCLVCVFELLMLVFMLGLILFVVIVLFCLLLSV